MNYEQGLEEYFLYFSHQTIIKSVVQEKNLISTYVILIPYNFGKFRLYKPLSSPK